MIAPRPWLAGNDLKQRVLAVVQGLGDSGRDRERRHRLKSFVGYLEAVRGWRPLTVAGSKSS
jgi:hypothetical protein